MRFYVRLKIYSKGKCANRPKSEGLQIGMLGTAKPWIQSTHVCQVPVDLRLDTDELRCAEDIRALLEAGDTLVIMYNIMICTYKSYIL